jgi:hypothetical protein
MKNPGFSSRFVRHLPSHNAKIRDSLAEQILSSSERRLLLVLLAPESAAPAGRWRRH